MTGATDGPLAGILRRLDTLERRNEALERRNRELEQGFAALSHRPDPSPAVGRGPSQAATAKPVDRRSLLKAGIALAGAAAVGTVVVDASPAAAANGGPLLIGVNPQTGTAATALNVTGSTATYGLGVQDNGWDGGGFLVTNKPAVFGHAKGTNFATGVLGYNEAAAGAGVSGQSVGGVGVTGTGSAGLSGYGTQYGAYCEASGSGIGVVGVGQTGLLTNGSEYGVVAQGNGVGGDGLLAWSAESVAVIAERKDLSRVQLATSTFHLQLTNLATRAAPIDDVATHSTGDVVMDSTGRLWFCVVGGTPGTWREVAGPGGAGVLHVLPVPKRAYDSRPGTAPGTGPKTPIAGNTTRTLDLTLNGTGLPAGATAAAVTILVVNAAAGNGNLTVWANGAAKPQANTMVWGGAAGGRYSSPAITALDPTGKVQVSASVTTDLVLDVVGYYR